MPLQGARCIVQRGDALYPQSLETVRYPPEKLYIIGSLELQQKKEFASFQVEQRAVIRKRIEPHSTLAGKLQFFLGADATKSTQQNTFNCFRKSSTQVVRW